MILYVVATPIGNLSDISPRALDILSKVQLIIAEDTRRIHKLLSHFGIKKPKLISYDDHYEKAKALNIITFIKQKNLDAALVSDSGTPCISDPGYRLISCAHENGVVVSSIPGPSALTAILSCSGLACNKFAFVGFLPTKKRDLLDEINGWKFMGVPSIVFFESTRRILNTLSLIKEYYPNALVCIGKELTKVFEQVVVSNIDMAINWIQQQPTLRGEIVIMLELRHSYKEELKELDVEAIKAIMIEEIEKGTHLKDILKILKKSGKSHNYLYKLYLDLKDNSYCKKY